MQTLPLDAIDSILGSANLNVIHSGETAQNSDLKWPDIFTASLQFKSVNISTILTSKQKCVRTFGVYILAITWNIYFLGGI